MSFFPTVQALAVLHPVFFLLLGEFSSTGTLLFLTIVTSGCNFWLRRSGGRSGFWLRSARRVGCRTGGGSGVVLTVEGWLDSMIDLELGEILINLYTSFDGGGDVARTLSHRDAEEFGGDGRT